MALAKVTVKRVASRESLGGRAACGSTDPHRLPIMHEDTGAKLRENWKEHGGAPCRHPKLELESSLNHYLTGRHVCTTCGALLTVDQLNSDT